MWVHHSDASSRKSSHRQFLVARDAELANDQNVELGAKLASDDRRHRHATTR